MYQAFLLVVHCSAALLVIDGGEDISPDWQLLKCWQEGDTVLPTP